MEITQDTKGKILRDLLKEKIFTDIFDVSGDIVGILSDVWPLDDLPSEDPRYKNASQDVVQHMVANYDWELEYLLKDRLNLVSGDNSIYNKFLEKIISPSCHQNVDTLNHLVSVISYSLKKENIQFILTGYQEGLPIFELSDDIETINTIPKNLKKNDTPFFFKSRMGLPQKQSSHEKPDEFPSLVLVKDSWDDYTFKTMYYLYYYQDLENCHPIGFVKIMKKETSSTELGEKFYILDTDYCSLGQGEEFYRNLSEKTEGDFISILFALKDVAFFPTIYEEFENEEGFKKSLIRSDKDERSARTIAHTFGGGSVLDRFKFKYEFEPAFSTTSTAINFNFDAESDLPKRIFALIGKNGTGKTQLLTSLARDLSDRMSGKFIPQTPLFGKVIAVSYSVFDEFTIPNRDNAFNYKYCGLKNPDNTFLSKVELNQRFFESAQEVIEKGRVSKLYKILSNFVEEDLLNSLILVTAEDYKESHKLNLESFAELERNMSSGQTILLYVVVEILAAIRLDSLILYDEPETHLHPNAISQLLNVVYDLVEEFDSYCIIATHSPVMVQGLTSDSVYVTEKFNDSFSIRQINLESFGENLSIVNDEIFGNREIVSKYKEIIDKFVTEGKSYEEVVQILETDNVPLSLNVKIYIRNVTN